MTRRRAIGPVVDPRQQALFAPNAASADLPDGLRYTSNLISRAEEADLVGRIATLPFEAFEFRGFLGRRRVVSFGWRYDFNRQTLEAVEAIPGFLLALRAQVAAFTGRDPERFQQALVLEYPPGAGIGWHRDRPQFGDVAGVSLLTPSPFRLRRRREPSGWERVTLTAAARSAYHLSGPVREEWEHSIPPVAALRYAVTFRTFR